MQARGPALERRPARQRGMVLFISLVVLVAMTLAGLALMRSVTSGVLVAGNLAAKQSITSVADWGVEAGRNWLLAQPVANLTNSGALGSGYFSSWETTFDPVNAPANWWKDNGVGVNLAGSAMNVADMEVRWVVHRLCKLAGQDVNAPLQECVTLQSKAPGSSQGVGLYGGLPLTSTQQPYYRVTVRVVDPRRTVSYIQTVVY
jgi:Tfp pilus assembly protein PilX